MENHAKKYQLVQDGKTYTLLTQIYQDKLRFACMEKNSLKPIVFTGEFSLADIKQLNNLFSYIISISEAQDLFDKLFTQTIVSIEREEKFINIIIIIKKENNIEENFSLQLTLFNENPTNNESMQESQNENNNSFQKNIVYSPINENINPEQNISQQSQTNQNLMLNNNINNRNNTYHYENRQSSKTKKIKIDTLTLSLRPMSQKNQEKEVIQNAPLIPQQPIESFIPPKIEKNIEINSVNPFSQIQTIQKTEIIKEKIIEIENLKNDNNKLNEIIMQLKKENELLFQENQNLKFKKSIPNGDKNQEILILKTENERYLKEIEFLKNQLIECGENRKKKEEEIMYLQIQMEELIENSDRIKEYLLQKEKEIEELKLFNDELIRRYKINESQFQKYLNQKQNNDIKLEDEMLTIQDTRLEIVKGDIIQNVKELELLSRKISKNNQKITFDLLYKATIDSDKAEAFHRKCDSAKSTIILVKSENGKRFGGYTTCDWGGNSIEKKDDNAFIFSLDKMAIYDIIPGEMAIGCYPDYGPVFLGCQIRIYNEFFTRGGTTFEKGTNYATEEDYELTGGLKKFEVKEIEVYSVELE